MTTYATNNPRGSMDPKDLFDNAQNLDFAVNDITKAFWKDRFGRNRPTMFGMEQAFSAQLLSQKQRFDNFIQSSGYKVIGDYTDGPLTITEYNQLIRYQNEFYKLTAATTLPFTTTGNDATSWANDSLHFVSVGDAALRQELSAPGGASLVGPGVMARGIDKFSIFNGNLGENATPGLRVDLNTLTGLSTGNGNFLNMIFIPSDQLDTTGKVAGQMIDHRFGGGAGGRHGFMSRLIQSSPQLSTTNDQNYVAAVAQVLCDAGDPIETSTGSVLFASESYAESRTDTGKVRAVIGSLHEAGVSGTVIPLDRIGVQVTSQGTRNATRVDAAIGVSSGTSRAAWKNGIKFSNVTGGQVFDSTSCAIILDPESKSQPNMTLDAIIKVKSSDVTFNNIIDTPRLKLSQSGLDINLSSSYIKLGGTVASNTPYVSFRSGATAAPGFDSRFIATGGNGSDAGGSLQAQCSTLIVSGTLRPSSANTSLCGTTSQPWSGGFTQTAFTVTSDETHKTKPIMLARGVLKPATSSDAEMMPPPHADTILDAWAEVDFVQFKYLDRVEAKGEDGARWHFGVIAQRAIEAFERHGLDAFAFGFACYDEWGGTEEVIDEESGEVITERVDAGSKYGIRYEEALVLEAALQRRNYARLLADQETMAARIEKLESLLSKAN